MAKVSGKMLDIDLDVVVDSEGHQLIREGNQTFGGVKTFNAPPHSQMSKPEADNTAVTKAMLKNITRCMNEWFEEALTVTGADIANGYILLSKEIPEGKESSLEIKRLEGAGPLVNGVDFGAETDRMLLSGYELEHVLVAGDELEVRYMICADVIVTLEDIQKIMYAPELGEHGLFVAFGKSAIYYSEDGEDWTKAVEDVGRFYSADYSPTLKRFVASYRGGYLVSNDGKEWTKHDGEAGTVLWAGSLGAFYCFCNNGNAYRTPDGLSWSEIVSNIFSGYEYSSVTNVIWDETRRRFWANVSREGEFSHSNYYNNSLCFSANGMEWQEIGGERFCISKDDDAWEISYLSPCYICVSPTRIWVDSVVDVSFDEFGRYDKIFAVSKDNGTTWTGYAKYFGEAYSGGQAIDIIDYAFSDVVAVCCVRVAGNDMFLGGESRYGAAISSDGEIWHGTNDFTMSGVLCYAQDRDTMLFYRGDGVIEVVTEFSARLKNAWFKRISFTKLKKYDNSGSGGGGGSGTSGGDGDAPIDTGRWERGTRLPGLFPGDN